MLVILVTANPYHLFSPKLFSEAFLLGVLKKTKRIFVFFSVKDRNLFHRVDTIGNITDGVHEIG